MPPNRVTNIYGDGDGVCMMLKITMMDVIFMLPDSQATVISVMISHSTCVLRSSAFRVKSFLFTLRRVAVRCRGRFLRTLFGCG